MANRDKMYTDRAFKANSAEIYFPQPKPIQQKYDRVVEIVRANPGISGGGIAKLFYPPTATGNLHQRMQGILLHVCYTRRIQCVNMSYFITEPK